MDEGRRTIRELNEKRRETLLFKTRTLEDVGRSLAERLGESSLPGQQGNYYRRFKQEIADSEASVESIQESLRRIKELDEEIAIKKLEKADREEETAPLYIQLGSYVLDAHFNQVPRELYLYKRQQALFLDRSASFKQRLLALEEPGGGSGFLWFGRAIQRAVIRRALKKIEKQLDQLRYLGGEQYAGIMEKAAGPAESAGDPVEEDKFSIILRDVRAKRQNMAELDAAIEVLEQEKNRIRRSFQFKEKPKRRIKILKERARKRHRDLLELYGKVGEAAGSDPVLQKYLEDEEKRALEKVRQYDRDMEENNREIGRVETAMAIDREQKKIARFERAVDGEKKRALNSEKNIAELNRKIAEAHKRIGELSELSIIL
ncbi:MAG: hypothetical protein LBP60_07210 [Spirochaetaceae bacterium]|jgi:hypothetical protein|nr:hypothetical protein [Spirochaetaceae bacterium]